MSDKDLLLKSAWAAMRRTRDALEGILDADDDLILSAPVIGGDGGEMKKEKTLVEQKREQIADLEIDVAAKLSIKRELDKQLKAEREGKEKPGTFTVKVGRLNLFSAPELPAPGPVEQPPVWNDDITAWVRKNAPDKLELITGTGEPELTLEQQAKFAHCDYVDACHRLTAAKLDLERIEKKVRDMAALMACVEAAA